jgi:hypothetical protein
MAITQQLQAESAALFTNTFTQSVTLGAGSNRLFLVAIPVDAFNTPGNGTPTSVTYGGVPLALVTDGTNVASSIQPPPTTGTTIAVFWYVLREAQLPANGPNNLVVNFDAASSEGFVVGWWILENCLQAAEVRSVANNRTTSPAGLTSLTATLAFGALSDACLCVGCNDTASGTIQITIGGVGLTEDFDVAMASARGAAGTDLTAPSLGTVACTMTYTLAGTQRAAISAIRLEEFSIPGGEVVLIDEPAGSVELEAA